MKYADLDSRYLFEPIAVETLGVLNSSANSLLKEIGHKISLNTGMGSLGRSVTNTRAFQFWCNGSTLFCCTTHCRSQTARTEFRTRNCLAMHNF